MSSRAIIIIISINYAPRRPIPNRSIVELCSHRWRLCGSREVQCRLVYGWAEQISERDAYGFE
jgi:hypothetical protein